LKSEWWQYAPWNLKGVQVDDFEAFFGRVDILTEKKIETYDPLKISIENIS